jgi:hypothetical protein
MIKVTDQTIENQVVILDGYHYHRCTFKRCQLIFCGMAPHNIEGCNLSPETGFGFNGPAQNTLNFLSSMHRSGPAGKALVETVFQSIRNGLPPQLPVAPLPEPKTKGPVN